MSRIILASTSPYRKEVLSRIGIPFETVAPDFDEAALPDEKPAQLVTRLAEGKAAAVAGQFKDSLIIGSDQVAVLDDSILGKPGSHENAVRQLEMASGKRVVFYTGLCLINTSTGKTRSCHETYTVTFRNLTGRMIENYLQAEQPYNCAGSFRSEGLGIVLFSKLEGTDPNTLIGLPLIRLIAMLEKEGVEII